MEHNKDDESNLSDEQLRHLLVERVLKSDVK